MTPEQFRFLKLHVRQRCGEIRHQQCMGEMYLRASDRRGCATISKAALAELLAEGLFETSHGVSVVLTAQGREAACSSE